MIQTMIQKGKINVIRILRHIFSENLEDKQHIAIKLARNDSEEKKNFIIMLQNCQMM